MSAIFRKPRRLTITVSQYVMERLQQCSDQQGRSLSNYAAFLLETSLQAASFDEARQGHEHSGAGAPIRIQRAV
jgi:hypothetical protein